MTEELNVNTVLFQQAERIHKLELQLLSLNTQFTQSIGKIQEGFSHLNQRTKEDMNSIKELKERFSKLVIDQALKNP